MTSWDAFRLLWWRLGRGADIDLSKDEREIEDRELSPTSAGHPRREDEDETNEPVKKMRSSRKSHEFKFGRNLRPSGGDDDDGASKVSRPLWSEIVQKDLTHRQRARRSLWMGFDCD